MKNNPKSIVVYTAIFGNKDKPSTPINLTEAIKKTVDFVLVTDSGFRDTGCYQTRLVKPEFKDLTKNARKVKILGFDGIREYKYAIWHDSSVILDASKIEKLISYSFDNILSTFDHGNQCIYAEGRSCIENRKDSPIRIAYQLLKYGLQLRYPTKNGLYETTMIVFERKYFNSSLRKSWWTDVQNLSRRDQLSLPVAKWKTDAKIGTLPGKGFSNEFSKYIGHQYYHYKSNRLLDKFHLSLIDKLCLRVIFQLEKHLSTKNNG